MEYESLKSEKKKINSEIKFNDESFKIKIGTIDKKNPKSIYIEYGSYISPMNDIEDYSSVISAIKRKISSFVGNTVSKNEKFLKDEIFVFDIADERISFGKKSYIEIQIYVKPSPLMVKEFGNDFKKMANEIKSGISSDILSFIKQLMDENDFSYSKVKK